MPRRMQQRGRLAIAAAAWTVPLLASAQESAPSARLAYERGTGAERCYDEATLREAVSARLGYVPFRDDASLLVRAQIARRGRGLRATVQLFQGTTARGERTLASTGPECGELSQALSLAISVAIDPLSLTRPAQSRAPEAPPPTPPPSSPSTSPSPPTAPAPASPPPATATASTPSPTLPTAIEPTRPAPPATPSLRAVFALTAHGSLGAAPDLTYGAALSLGVRARFFSASLGGRLDAGAWRGSAAQSPGRVFGALRTGTLALCAHYRILAGCALGSLGVLDGQGADVTVTRSARTLFASLGARIQLDVPIAGPLAFRAQLDGEVPLTPTTLEIDGAPLWTTPWVYATLSAGLSIALP